MTQASSSCFGRRITIEIPKSQWPRVVAAYEKMYKEAADPFERLRLLRVLQTFGATNIANKMKAELGRPEPRSVENPATIKAKSDGRLMNCRSPIRSG